MSAEEQFWIGNNDSMAGYEACSNIELQTLLNQTAERLCLRLKDPIKALTEPERKQLEIHYQWECLGSNFLNNFCITAIMPLKLVTGEKTLWTNPNPKKTFFLRPIQIRYCQMSSDISEDIQKVKELIPMLKKSDVKEGDTIVKHIVPLEPADDLPISEMKEKAQRHRERFECQHKLNFTPRGMMHNVFDRLLYVSDPYTRILVQSILDGCTADESTSPSSDGDGDD